LQFKKYNGKYTKFMPFSELTADLVAKLHEIAGAENPLFKVGRPRDYSDATA
jgi:hypothetical protein